MALRRTGHRNGELIAELLAHKLHQLGSIVQIAAGALPAEGQIAAQSQHMVDAMGQVVVQLLLDALPGVADAGEVSDRRAFAVLLNLVQNFQILTHISTARAVGAGDVVGIQRIQLLQHAAFPAQLFHTRVRLGGEHLKGKGGSFFKNVGYAHSDSPP